MLYDQQDEGLWNRELIERGDHYLDAASEGDKISSYHLEAGIAFWHCHKEDTPEKWEGILDRFYYALLGELYTGLDDHKAYEYLLQAYALAKTDVERQILRGKIDAMK